jgi:hypothetical protein
MIRHVPECKWSARGLPLVLVLVLVLLCEVGCATSSGGMRADALALGASVVSSNSPQIRPAVETGGMDFCDLNPEGCPQGAKPDVSRFSSQHECKAACWASYEHNRAYCEDLRHDDAAYRRCMIAAGLLLGGCLSACAALP